VFGPGTWGSMQAWMLSNSSDAATDAKATLTPAPYNNAARARNMAGAVKCGAATYLIGGLYGKASVSRSDLVDRLSSSFGNVNATTIPKSF
jgi:hypothetical protein